jgi:hypothetical protein
LPEPGSPIHDAVRAGSLGWTVEEEPQNEGLLPGEEAGEVLLRAGDYERM